MADKKKTDEPNKPEGKTPSQAISKMKTRWANMNKDEKKDEKPISSSSLDRPGVSGRNVSNLAEKPAKVENVEKKRKTTGAPSKKGRKKSTKDKKRIPPLFQELPEDLIDEEDEDSDQQVDTGTEAEIENPNEIYCWCQRRFPDRMIGCDNLHCMYQWYHFRCLGLTQDPISHYWFCIKCRRDPFNPLMPMPGTVLVPQDPVAQKNQTNQNKEK